MILFSDSPNILYNVFVYYQHEKLKQEMVSANPIDLASIWSVDKSKI